MKKEIGMMVMVVSFVVLYIGGHTENLALALTGIVLMVTEASVIIAKRM